MQHDVHQAEWCDGLLPWLYNVIDTSINYYVIVVRKFEHVR